MIPNFLSLLFKQNQLHQRMKPGQTNVTVKIAIFRPTNISVNANFRFYVLLSVALIVHGPRFLLCQFLQVFGRIVEKYSTLKQVQITSLQERRGKSEVTSMFAPILVPIVKIGAFGYLP